MGVLKALRNESTAEFLAKADDLRIFTTKLLTKFPKKYTFYGAAAAYNLAQAVFDDLTRANSLYLSKDRPEYYQQRRDLFNKALGNLNCLSSHIVYLCELADNAQDKNPQGKKKKPISDKSWLTWASKINITKSLVAKVKDSDTQRIKKV